jgi:flagellar basal-body rod modification protein FlgD
MSTTTPVTNTSNTGTSNSSYSSGNPNTTLTQADFLQIMVAQFENQDPMADSDGGGSSGTSDYVQELMSMTNITTLQTMSQQQNIELAGSLPGSTVELNVNGDTVSGQVTGAQIENATLYITVNGTQYPATDLMAVTQTQAQAQAAATNTNSSTGSTGSTTPASSS